MIRKLASGEYRLYSRKANPQTGKRRNLQAQGGLVNYSFSSTHTSIELLRRYSRVPTRAGWA
jgi:hypothetical protein